MDMTNHHTVDHPDFLKTTMAAPENKEKTVILIQFIQIR